MIEQIDALKTSLESHQDMAVELATQRRRFAIHTDELHAQELEISYLTHRLHETQAAEGSLQASITALEQRNILLQSEHTQTAVLEARLEQSNAETLSLRKDSEKQKNETVSTLSQLAIITADNARLQREVDHLEVGPIPKKGVNAC